MLLDEVLVERPVRSDAALEPGQRVTVKVTGVNLFARQLNLKLIDADGGPEAATSEGAMSETGTSETGTSETGDA